MSDTSRTDKILIEGSIYVNTDDNSKMISLARCLERELAEKDKRIAELEARNKTDLEKLVESVTLGSKQANEFDRILSEKDKRIAELESDNKRLESESNTRPKCYPDNFELDLTKIPWEGAGSDYMRLIDLARQLERELADKDKRIAELEKAIEGALTSLAMAADTSCDQPAWLDLAVEELRKASRPVLLGLPVPDTTGTKTHGQKWEVEPHE